MGAGRATQLRILTGLTLAAVLLAALFLLPAFWFGAFLGAVVLVGAWEWSRLAGLRGLPARLLYTLGFLGLLLAAPRLLDASLEVLLLAALVWWLFAFFLILVYPRQTPLWGRASFLCIAGPVVLIPGWLALLYLRELEDYAAHILLLLAAVAAADIGAWFCGRRFGRRPLAPRVSPNKTWEGFWGGLVACCLLVILALGLLARGEVLALAPRQWLELLPFAALLAALSVVGDLFESMLKRHQGLKDSGKVLPGHGGVLDRIDGITAAAPAYALLAMRLGIS